MKKTVLAVMLSAATLASAAQAADRVGVTIYKYDDNFMSTMRKSLELSLIHIRTTSRCRMTRSTFCWPVA